MRLKPAVAGLLLLLSLSISAQTTLYVSTAGNDQANGSENAPIATLEKARDTIRQLRKDGKLAQPVTVSLSGDFYLADSFKLEAEDSGEKDHPITYRAQPGKSARLIGGRAVEHFEAVTDKETLARLDPSAKAHVRVANLTSQGITDFGELKVRGMRNQADAALELFFDGQPMQLAQYPNEGWLTVATIPGGNEGDTVTCESARLARWAHASDAWAYGYWHYGWADFYLPVKSVDPEKHAIQLGQKPYYGLAEKQRFRMLNLLEELDQPGEWYLDRAGGMLYFWPPKPIKAGAVVVSLLKVPLILSEGASNVRFEGMTFEGTRGSGISIRDGDHVVVAGCTVRNVGANAVTISGGTSHEVISSDIYGCGEGGITINGGDRTTLTPGSHAAINNHIYNIGRTYHTYRPGVLLDGVGNRAANNLIHDCPHQGIAFGGNDHVIESNEIHHVMLETDDAGAIYCGRDWTKRGTVIRNNYIHHSGPSFAPPLKPAKDPAVVLNPLDVGGVISVYLDDLHSGSLVENNILHGATISVLIGGGRDNIVRNNIMIDSKYGVWLDARGLTWAKEECGPGGSHRMYELLKEVNHDQPPYSVRYPQLANLLNDDPQAPKGNVVDRNIMINVATASHANDDIAKGLFLVEHTLSLNQPPDRSPLRMVKRVAEAQMNEIGFIRIAVENTGLFKDKFRTALPAVPHEN